MYAQALALLAVAAQSTIAAEIVSYWGNGGYDPADGDLAPWCADNEHISIINLAFIGTFGSGQYPSGSLGACTINSDGTSSGCEQLEQDIGTCQSLGKKIFLSLGGGQGPNGPSYGLNSEGDAKGVAYSLWNSWADPSVVAQGTPRPLGNIRIDGWDIDLEDNPDNEDGNGNLATMLNTLRGYFSSDPDHTYYISGAPQCPHPDTNMGNAIMNSKFDYLWIQFYNNPCAAADVYKNPNDNPDSVGTFNFDEWPAYIANGQSASAKLLVGIPGNKAEANDYDYIETANLPKVVSAAQQVQGFDGIMVYEVGDTKSVTVKNGCDYFQQIYSVLTTGHDC